MGPQVAEKALDLTEGRDELSALEAFQAQWSSSIRTIGGSNTEHRSISSTLTLESLAHDSSYFQEVDTVKKTMEPPGRRLEDEVDDTSITSEDDSSWSSYTSFEEDRIDPEGYFLSEKEEQEEESIASLETELGCNKSAPTKHCSMNDCSVLTKDTVTSSDSWESKSDQAASDKQVASKVVFLLDHDIVSKKSEKTKQPQSKIVPRRSRSFLSYKEPYVPLIRLAPPNSSKAGALHLTKDIPFIPLDDLARKEKRSASNIKPVFVSSKSSNDVLSEIPEDFAYERLEV